MTKLEPIAIVGIGCRFPSAKNPAEFWQVLSQGIDAIVSIPPDRWDLDSFYDPEPGKAGKMYSCHGGFLDRVDGFDAAFFGISPREAEKIDPQQRLVLEVAWEALEDGGIVPEKLSGTPTGVFIGCGNYDYGLLLARNPHKINAYDGTGSSIGVAANRLSYSLNLRGPSLAIETACSSSLVALHLACQSLRERETKVAIVGAVSLMLSPEQTIAYCQAKMMAADGRCKTFDAKADGYVRGEGCGIVILKPLADAIRDGDRIQAVIRGSAVNQDGLSNGLTAPNGPSQQAVIRQALANAGVEAREISYIEAHGTGTSLGDPIEVKSLKAVLMKERSPEQTCWLGSVKTNIGHLEAAAGMAGLLKVVLSLQHRQIPPHLHLEELNPYISFEDSTFIVPTALQPWETHRERRLAGISSFGFGGTNAHVILEEFTQHSSVISQQLDRERPFHLITLSAKTAPALEELVQNYQILLQNHPPISLPDLALTSNIGRTHFDRRYYIVAASIEELQQKLAATTIQDNDSDKGNRKGSKIAFLFTGQGSQYGGMGWELYQTEKTFRISIDRCDRLLTPYLDRSLLDLLDPNNTDNLLDRTIYTQPALFALEYSLYQLWKSWEIEPNLVLGHSVGEYVAACIAGVFSLEDGLKLIAHRGRLMQSLPENGAMVACLAGVKEIEDLLVTHKNEVAIAAINGAKSLTLSGEKAAISDICDQLNSRGIKTKFLKVSHAFHSPLMQPILAEFETIASQITFAPPQIPLISNLTGELATAAIATPEYWCRHLRETVRFADSIATLAGQKIKIRLELGAQPILSGMGSQNDGNSENCWLPSLRQGYSDWQVILDSLGKLYLKGKDIKWSGLNDDSPRQIVNLPTYPFQRQRYWGIPKSIPTKQDELKEANPIIQFLERGDGAGLQAYIEQNSHLSAAIQPFLREIIATLLEKNQKYSRDWLYQIQWQLQPLTDTVKQRREEAGIDWRRRVDERGIPEPETWLILGDRAEIGEQLARQISAEGHESICLTTQELSEIGNLDDFEAFERLFLDRVRPHQRILKGVIHLWSLGATANSLESLTMWGCGTILHLVQTLIKHCSLSLPRLWLVTRGTANLGTISNIFQTPLWGLGKTIALEHPDLWGGLLDLDPVTDKQEEKTIWAEMKGNNRETAIAWREGQRYVSRLVKTIPDNRDSLPISLSPDKSYLITGGLGALGLEIAGWLGTKGAKQIVLLGRSQPSATAIEKIALLERQGLKILVMGCDVAQKEEIERVLFQISASMPLLGGVIHAAGILDDGMVRQQTWQRFDRVFAPKVIGAWHLHQLTQDLPLDFFICFSSISSILGSPGQSNYAAANAFLDSLAHYRQQQGLPALTINWSQWAEAGMAAKLNRQQQNRLAARGLEAIDLTGGLETIEAIWQIKQAQIAVLPVDWAVFCQQLRHLGTNAFLSEVIETILLNPSTSATFRERLQATTKELQRELLISHLQQEVALVLGWTDSQLPEIDRGFFELGMDSLMAVELKNRLDVSFQASLPTTIAFEAPTIQDLANYLATRVLAWETVTVEVIEPENLSLPPDLEKLSDDEIEAFLAEKLTKLESLLRSQK